MRIDKNTTIRLGDRNIVKIKKGDVVIWQKDNIDYLYIENTYGGGNTISVKQTITGQPDSNTYAKTLQYSKDKTNWSTITLSSTAYNISLNQGEKVYFRGNEGVLNYYAKNGTIQAITNILGTQTHTIGGNINTLVNYTTPNKLTLPQGVFAGLFQNNITITSAENLTLQPSSDDSLSNFAYCLMFSGCSALITPPSEIPATKQGHASCSKMFLDCTQLKTPPALKSTILGNYCFSSIFKNCTSLISAPELPATTLTSYCYTSAFEGCTSLVNAPQLPAKTLTTSCYQSLFYGCSKLNNITVYANNISATNCTTDWLSGVASTGTFHNLGTATYPTGVSGIPTGWTEVKPVVGPDYLYIENTYAGENTITLTTKQSGTPASGTYATSVECSKDKLTWNTLSLTPGVTNTISLNQGEKIYFRNDSGYFNYTDNSNNYYTTITGSKSHKLGGNINTLINYTDLSNVSLSQGCFNRMFISDIELVDASDLKLPSTTLVPHCYRALLNNCQSLLYAPALPATTLANRCYYAMFYGDSSLITAPELPATSLVNACYDSIFRNCTSLTSVTIYATSTADNAFVAWLYNVAPSGTVYNNGSISLPKNSPSGIPTGWTEVKS